LFSIGMQGLLDQLKSEFPDVTLFAFLDDVTAAGDSGDLVALANRFSTIAKERGLELNRGKSELFLPPGQQQPADTGDMQIKRDGVRVLGSPVGSSSFEDQWCQQQIRQMKKIILLKTETSIPVQSRYLLLRDSVVPSFNHLLRTVPPANRENATSEFDGAIEEISSQLLGMDVFEDSHELSSCTQLHLPLRFGGLGLVKASSVSTAAYVASVWEAGVGFEDDECSSFAGILRQQDVSISEEDLKKVAPNRKQQKVFSDQLHRGDVNRYLRTLDQTSVARVKAAQEVGASDWLRALPTTSAKKFSDLDWRIGVRFRLGLKVTPFEIPDICPLCSAFVHDVGSHAFTCRYADLMNHRTNRHNILRDIIIGALSSWGLSPEKEPKIRQGSNLRGDIELQQFSGTTVLDVSVIHPTVVGTQQNLRPSAATKLRERSKLKKYEQLCQNMDKKAQPFVFQTYGGLGEKGLEFLSQLKQRPASLYVFQPKKYVEDLRVGLSCRFMQSNCKLISRWLQLVLPKNRGGVATYAGNFNP
jgi:hypothetical protein